MKKLSYIKKQTAKKNVSQTEPLMIMYHFFIDFLFSYFSPKYM